MKKIFDLKTLFILLVMLIMVAPTVGNIFDVKIDDNGINEKRELRDYPVEICDDYFNRIHNWYVDNAPYRSNIINLYQNISSRLNVFYRSNIHPKLSKLLTPKWYRNNINNYIAPQVDNTVIYGKDDWLFYTGNESELYYTGDNILSDEEMQEYSEKIEELNSICLKRGIKFGLCIIPNKESVYDIYMPSYDVKNVKREEKLIDYISKHSNANAIYLLENLKNENEYATYYKQDTHWNSYGAFIGIKELYKMFNVHSDTSKINILKENKTGGDLSDMCGYFVEYETNIIRNDLEVVVNRIYTNDNNSIEIYESNSNNKQKFMLIGDSFREAMRETVTKDFEKTYIIHRSYVDDDLGITKDAVNSLKDGDILTICLVERYDDKILNIVDNLIGYLQ